MFAQLFQRVLALAPHGDDVEFGCGGSLARLIESGAEVRSVVFSICEEWVPKGFPADIVATEAHQAVQALGMSADNLTVLRYRASELWLRREAIFDHLATLREEFQPQLVLAPASDDLHQDHACIAQEARRVFKHATVLGYELPWNSVQFATIAFIQLDEQHVARKLRALACYHSQASKPYADGEIIRSLARVRGLQVGAEYAECFEVYRWVM